MSSNEIKGGSKRPNLLNTLWHLKARKYCITDLWSYRIITQLPKHLSLKRMTFNIIHL